MKAPVVVLYVRIILFLCCILPNSGAGVSVGEEEVSALLDIKSGFNYTSSPLRNLQDWKLQPFTTSLQPLHCNWTGVSCDSAGFVQRLDLSGMNLTGKVSTSISRFPRLLYLNLCCNSLSSFLPKHAFANLTSLKVLDVSDNSFVGEFPLGLGGSVGLTFVNVSGNDFTGKLPEDLGNVTGLEVLDFRGSYFQGSIPESYKMLKNLRYLGLSGNNLSGRLPAFLGEMTALEKLIIGYNLFHGPVPKEIGKLKKLLYLDMAVGNFTGGVPQEFEGLEHLRTIFLYKNKFDGVIPKQLGNISTLVFLDLSDNRISGEIPMELGKLENLELLNLMCNKLVGSVPAELGHLRRLKVLELWNNKLTGHLPEKLGGNTSLQWLDVSSNSLSGGIPISLCDGKNLTKLILFNNDFTGSIPASLTKCHTLIRVRIHNNRLNGTIPDGFGKLQNLQRLELAGNEITGTIPEDFSSSVSLSFIDISRNRIHVALPFTIFSIPNLQTFIASDNEVVGEIPDHFQNCPFLTELNLSNNRHTGRIPATLTACNKLVYLDLSNNDLTGEIPPAVAMMPSLSILDLSHNKLHGSIPADLGTSPALETLNVSYNNLTGPVPINGVLRTIDPTDLTGNTGLCGGVLPPCSDFFTPKRLNNVHFKHVILGLIVGISAVFSVGILLLGMKWIYQKWRIECDGVIFFRGNQFAQESDEWPWRITAFQRLNFTSSEVLACVIDSNVIGMGATGIVYKAEMPRHHTTVAVKKLWKSELDTELSDNNAGVDIAGEANLLGRLRHRNIVQMLGFLHNNNDVMIVYEYMPNGNLWDALHGSEERKNIAADSPASPPPSTAGLLVDWVSRYNVATGVAHGLAYLHHDCRPPVIHRDIKSNNILLDSNLEARIADFGLAKTLLRKNETISIIVGSYGYIAPEYGYTAKVDQKSDIYSFGVVLMELVTGRKPIDSELFGESQDIVGWVREKLRVKGGIGEVLDRTICGQCQHVQDEMVMVLRIAMLCTARLPKDRPSSRDVLSMLGEAKPRRKSSSSSSTGGVKEKPVFTTAPESDYL